MSVDFPPKNRRDLVHKLPFETTRQLCEILDVGDLWKTLADEMPGISNVDIEGCQKFGITDSPSRFLLRIWASKGYCITDLYIVLARLRLVRCMAVIRNHVDPAYHELERRCVAGSTGSPKTYTSTSRVANPPSSRFSRISTQPTTSSARPPATISSDTPSMHTTGADSSAELYAGLQNTPAVRYEELQIATEDFAPSRIIGKGGYGVVYRGEWKHTQVAVKRIHANNDRGGQHLEKERLRQSLQELRTLAKYRHDNVLPIYAFSLDGPQPCLVYQFMANGSLEDRLLCRKGTPPLTWIQKREIAEGSARGLLFLHSIARTPIIHGDVKTANILLDKHLEPKLGDFGLSRDGQLEADAEEKTPLIASHIKGTLAYLPPEFITSKILSTKLDVYSFGVVLLEIATGLRAYVDSRVPHSLVEYAEYAIKEHRGKDHTLASQLMDRRTPSGNPDFDTKWFLRMYKLGLRCASRERSERPGFKEIVDELREGEGPWVVVNYADVQATQ